MFGSSCKLQFTFCQGVERKVFTHVHGRTGKGENGHTVSLNKSHCQHKHHDQNIPLDPDAHLHPQPKGQRRLDE